MYVSKRLRDHYAVSALTAATAATRNPKLTRKQAVSKTQDVAWKLAKSTGKAMWIGGTTFLILVVPLIIEMDREAQFNDLEWQQAALYGGAPPQKM
ncbi:mitochondrial import receptor subunit TOM9-2 [Tanacetum coccineum]